MSATTVDITLAARAARHLYVTVTVGAFVLLLVSGAWVYALPSIGFSKDYLRDNWNFLPFYILGFPLLIAAFYGVNYARKELNGLAYVAAGFCAGLDLSFVVLVIVAGVVEPDPDYPPAAVAFTIALFGIAGIYFVRVLFDFGRLARNRYSSLGRTALGVANAVSALCRTTRSPVPSLHRPTDPLLTYIYAALFVVSIPVVFLFNFVTKIPVVGLLPLVALGAMARRHYVLRADKVLSLDDRAPILFLRSFGDDKVRLWGRGWYGKFRRRTIDEAIKGFAQRLGPFVAIANPQTKLPRLGAAQSYFSDNTWQDAIARWVAMTRMIVMVAGRTEGIRWELDHIFSNEHDIKLVILFPPALRRNPAAAMQWLSRHFSNTRYAADLTAIDPKRTIAIGFQEDGLLIVETRRIHRHEVDYLAAFQVLIYWTAASRSPAELNPA
jgi:hypothetical protein